MSLTDKQRANLEKLASHLEALPADYKHFGMEDWVLAKSWRKELNYALHNGGVPSCGSAACAIGHGPAAGILVPEHCVSDFNKRRYVNWEQYSKEAFAQGSQTSAFLFSSFWAHFDDSHQGAAARIRYVLKHGAPPPGWNYDARTRDQYAPYRIDAKAQSDA